MNCISLAARPDPYVLAYYSRKANSSKLQNLDEFKILY